MTSPWPLFDEMLVSLPLDNLLCCSSSLPFGVTQLSIYRLDIIPIYLCPVAIFALLSTENNFLENFYYQSILETFGFFVEGFSLTKIKFLLISKAVKTNNYAWCFWSLCKPCRKQILNLPIGYYNNYCKKLSVKTYESYSIWSIQYGRNSTNEALISYKMTVRFMRLNYASKYEILIR